MDNGDLVWQDDFEDERHWDRIQRHVLPPKRHSRRLTDDELRQSDEQALFDERLDMYRREY